MKGGLEKIVSGLFLPPLPHCHHVVIGLDKSLIDILKCDFSFCSSYDQRTAEVGFLAKP